VGHDIMKRRWYVRRVVSGKWFWSGGVLMQSIHAMLGWGPPGKPLHSGPPPPTLKGRMVRGVQKFLSFVHLHVPSVGSLIYALLLTIIPDCHRSMCPLIFPPPPPLKVERSGGVWKLISSIDLGANSSVVDLCTIFNLRA
jgi:hypothetical protein